MSAVVLADPPYEQQRRAQVERWRRDPQGLAHHVDQVVKRVQVLTAQQRRALAVALVEHPAAPE